MPSLRALSGVQKGGCLARISAQDYKTYQDKIRAPSAGDCDWEKRRTSHQESMYRSPTVGIWQPRGCEEQSRRIHAALLCEPNPLSASCLASVVLLGLPSLCRCTSICIALDHSCKQGTQGNGQYHHDFYLLIESILEYVLAAKCNCCKMYVVISRQMYTRKSGTSKMLCNVCYPSVTHLYYYRRTVLKIWRISSCAVAIRQQS